MVKEPSPLPDIGELLKQLGEWDRKNLDERKKLDSIKDGSQIEWGGKKIWPDEDSKVQIVALEKRMSEFEESFKRKSEEIDRTSFWTNGILVWVVLILFVALLWFYIELYYRYAQKEQELKQATNNIEDFIRWADARYLSKDQFIESTKK